MSRIRDLFKSFEDEPSGLWW